MSVVDLIIALVVVISVLVGFKRGFVKTLVGLVSLVLAFLLAYTFAPPLSEKLYDNHLEPVLSKQLGIPEQEVDIDIETVPETSRPLFIGGNYAYIAPKRAAAIDISKLKNIEGLISNLDPKTVEKMDAAEMQKLVNFLCSSACANKSISSCVSAYNKKYGTKVDAGPILKAAGVSGSTKIPAAISLLGMKIDVKNPIINVQKKNAEAAVAAAAAASKAASSSKAAASKTSGAVSSKTAASKNASSKTASSRVSSATSSAASVVSQGNIITDTVEGFTEDIISTAKQAARTIAIKLVSSVVFVILFILIRLVLMLLAKLLSGIIDKIPVVSGINKLLGGILGIAGGLIISAVLVVGVVSVSPLITDDRYVQAVDNSLICRTVTKMIYADGGNEDTVTVGDSGQEDEYVFNEDDFDFSEDDFDFSEDGVPAEQD